MPNKVHLIIAAVAFVILAGVLGYMAFQQNPPAPKVSSPPPTAPSVSSQPTAPAIDTSTWQTYRNDKYGFEVKHPASWKVGSSTSYGKWAFSVSGNGGNFTIIPAGEFDHGNPFDKPRVSIIEVAGRSVDFYFYNREGDENDYSTLSFPEPLPSSWTNANRIEMVGDQNLLNKILSTFKFTK